MIVLVSPRTIPDGVVRWATEIPTVDHLGAFYSRGRWAVDVLWPILYWYRP